MSELPQWDAVPGIFLCFLSEGPCLLQAAAPCLPCCTSGYPVFMRPPGITAFGCLLPRMPGGLPSCLPVSFCRIPRLFQSPLVSRRPPPLVSLAVPQATQYLCGLRGFRCSVSPFGKSPVSLSLSPRLLRITPLSPAGYCLLSPCLYLRLPSIYAASGDFNVRLSPSRLPSSLFCLLFFFLMQDTHFVCSPCDPVREPP